VWSDWDQAAIILGELDLPHHVFLTIMFGIISRDRQSGTCIVAIVRDRAHWARPGHDRAQLRDGQVVDGAYLPLVARITVGRGDFGEETDAIVSRVAGLARLRSPFGYIEA
jgi:hypothetical protein